MDGEEDIRGEKVSSSFFLWNGNNELEDGGVLCKQKGRKCHE